MAIVAFSNADQNWRLAAKAIVAVAVSLLHAFGREGILPFSRERSAFTDGICAAPALIGKPAGRPALAGKIISPPKSILLTFSGLSRRVFRPIPLSSSDKANLITTAAQARNDWRQLTITLTGINYQALRPGDIPELQASEHFRKFQQLTRTQARNTLLFPARPWYNSYTLYDSTSMSERQKPSAESEAPNRLRGSAGGFLSSPLCRPALRSSCSTSRHRRGG